MDDNLYIKVNDNVHAFDNLKKINEFKLED